MLKTIFAILIVLVACFAAFCLMMKVAELYSNDQNDDDAEYEFYNT